MEHRSTPTIREELEAHRDEVAAQVVSRCFELRPELERRYGPIGRKKCHEDTIYHLRYLTDAAASGSSSLFVSYIGWAKALLAGYKIPAQDLEFNLQLLREALKRHLSERSYVIVGEIIQQALDALPNQPDELATMLNPDEPHHFLAREYLMRLMEGNRREASSMIMRAVETGVNIKDIYIHVFQSSQREIGRLWQSNQLSVAQEHFCTAATQLIMSQLYSRIFSNEKSGRSLVATSVGGELHEIGIRMIADFFEMEGWDTYYLGANTPASSVIKMVTEKKADILAVSATMSYHVTAVTDLIAAVRKTPSCSGVKILVGGYPFNIDSDLWRKVGADAFATSAEDVVAISGKVLHT